MSSLQTCHYLHSHVSVISFMALYYISHENQHILNLPTKTKTYTVTSSPNFQLLSTLFFPHLLHPLQICSTCSLSDVRLMFLHYHQQNKTKRHKSVFQVQTQLITISSSDIVHIRTLRSLIPHIHSTPLAHSPHSLCSAHSFSISTPPTHRQY